MVALLVATVSTCLLFIDTVVCEGRGRASDQGEASGMIPEKNVTMESSPGAPSSTTWAKTFRDCANCPQMIVIPAGEFIMGSPASEEGRFGEEAPLHRVIIEQPFALGIYEVTRAEFFEFVKATNYKSRGCNYWMGKEWSFSQSKDWANPGFDQSDRHPVTCVSWNDAQAYVHWLSSRTGQRYRLPSEAEWEYAARAGTATARYWGNDASAACLHANGADLTTREVLPVFPEWAVAQCRDGFVYTAPVGTFQPNQFGLHDMLGNVMEWTEDCWNGRYTESETKSLAQKSGDCTCHVLRGSSWGNKPSLLRSAYRYRRPSEERYSIFGFRVARQSFAVSAADLF